MKRRITLLISISETKTNPTWNPWIRSLYLEAIQAMPSQFKRNRPLKPKRNSNIKIQKNIKKKKKEDHKIKEKSEIMLMKKYLKGEAFLSPVIYLNSYLEPIQRSLSRFLESDIKENFKEETGNNLSRIHYFQSLSFKTGI
jgi:hypothetical protein